MTRCLGRSLGQCFVDEVNFADQLWSEINPPGEPGLYAVSSGFQLVVEVRPLANFPILYLHNRHAFHRNWHLSQTPVQKRFSPRSRKRPFTDGAASAAEDRINPSLGIR